MSARSHRFFAGTVSSTSAVALYTVPAGWVALVKFLSVFNPGGTSTTFSMNALTGGGTVSTHIVGLSVPAGNGLLEQLGVVLNAGEELTGFRGSGGNVEVIVCGALLNL